MKVDEHEKSKQFKQSSNPCNQSEDNAVELFISRLYEENVDDIRVIIYYVITLWVSLNDIAI